MSYATLIRDMIAEGATPQLILLAVEAVEKLDNQKADERAKVAERKRRQRDKKRDESVTVTGQSQDIADTPPFPAPPNENNLTPPTHTPEYNTTRVRAVRLSENWQPNVDYPPNVSKLLALWPPGRVEIELDAFRDYWTSRSKDAAKLDWNKTWHNRIRDQHDRIVKNGTPNRGRNQPETGMGVSERAARQAIHELSGGTGSFADCGGPSQTSDYGGGGGIIDALPSPMRSIGYATGRPDGMVSGRDDGDRRHSAQ